MQQLAAPPHARLAGAQAPAGARSQALAARTAGLSVAVRPSGWELGACGGCTALQHPIWHTRRRQAAAHLKFSTVLGTTSANRVITMRPASSPAIVMSKNTRGLSISSFDMLHTSLRKDRETMSRVREGPGSEKAVFALESRAKQAPGASSRCVQPT